MNPFMGFSSALSGPQAGLPSGQSRQIGAPAFPHTIGPKDCELLPFHIQICLFKVLYYPLIKAIYQKNAL